MQLRTLFATAGVVGIVLLTEYAQAQNQAPFSIRRPPDGANVKEKVRVHVPLASIPEGGYIAYSIDGRFVVSLAPSEEEREKAKPGAVFEYVWDTKTPTKNPMTQQEVTVQDGKHTIAAALFDAKGKQLQSSSITVNVANKIAADPGPIYLRYRFVDGSNRNYNRTGDTTLVTGLSGGMGGSTDQELVSQKSELLVAVEDKYPNGHAMVRNKLTSLTLRQGGQETTFPNEQLPKSLYQELDTQGNVVYQNQTVSFDQFAQLGIPVSATLELPKLPTQAVRVGDSWQTPNVSLDLPGTAPDKQPRATVTSKLEGIEWQNGFETAHVHQRVTAGPAQLKAKSILFGTVEVLAPQVTFERDIYIAFRSGTLVKMVRKLTVTGKSATAVSQVAGAPAGMAGGMRGGDDAMPGPGMGPSMPGMSGGIPRPGAGMRGGAGVGLDGPPAMGGRGGRGGRGGGPPAGFSGYGSGPGAPGGRQMGGRSMPGLSGSPQMGGAPSGYGGGMMGGAPGGMGGQATQNTSITMRSTTTTEIITAQSANH